MFRFTKGQRDAIIYFISNLLGFASDYSKEDYKKLSEYYLGLGSDEIANFTNLYDLFNDTQIYDVITTDMLSASEIYNLYSLLEYLDENDLWGDCSYEGVELYMALN